MAMRFLAVTGWLFATVLSGYAVSGKLYRQGDLVGWCGTGGRPPFPPPPPPPWWWVLAGIGVLSVIGLVATWALQRMKGKFTQMVG